MGCIVDPKEFADEKSMTQWVPNYACDHISVRTKNRVENCTRSPIYTIKTNIKEGIDFDFMFACIFYQKNYCLMRDSLNEFLHRSDLED